MKISPDTASSVTDSSRRGGECSRPGGGGGSRPGGGGGGPSPSYRTLSDASHLAPELDCGDTVILYRVGGRSGERFVCLGAVAAADPERLFVVLQGEVWSPRGEARELIEARGADHTSLSVGDRILLPDGRLLEVAPVGFAEVETVGSERLEQLSAGYGLDLGGYGFELWPDVPELPGVVWEAPVFDDVPWVAGGHESCRAAGLYEYDAAVYVFSPGQGEVLWPASFRRPVGWEACGDYRLLGSGRLSETDRECPCRQELGTGGGEPACRRCGGVGAVVSEAGAWALYGWLPDIGAGEGKSGGVGLGARGST